MDRNISILLATYNGGLYLEDQIESIINQSYNDWNLFISDDGSTDNTLDIVLRYCNTYDNIILLNDNFEHRGSCSRFIWMLSKIDSKYYMFCDQDDIWVRTKIELSINYIQDIQIKHPNKPLLVFSDLIVVDHQLNIISDSFFKYSNIFFHNYNNFNFLSVSNCCTGNTFFFNKEVRDIVFNITCKPVMHDWFVSLVALNYGYIYILPQSTVLYRQHNNNHIGAVKYFNFYYYLFYKLSDLLNIFKKNFQTYLMVKSVNIYYSPFKYLWYKLYFKFYK